MGTQRLAAVPGAARGLRLSEVATQGASDARRRLQGRLLDPSLTVSTFTALACNSAFRFDVELVVDRPHAVHALCQRSGAFARRGVGRRATQDDSAVNGVDVHL